MIFNKTEFIRDIWKKRGGKTRSQYIPLRMAAKQARISHTILYRVEKGQIPDIDVFVRLCTWMKVHPKKYFKRT